MTLHRSILLASIAAVLFAFAACGEADTTLPDPDAGVIADAGSNDTDAGQSETDAGTRPDAGESTDAGTEPDAGTQPDAGTGDGPPCTLELQGPECKACIDQAEAVCSAPGGPCESEWGAVVSCAQANGCSTSPMDWQCAGTPCWLAITSFDSCNYNNCPDFKACFP